MKTRTARHVSRTYPHMGVFIILTDRIGVRIFKSITQSEEKIMAYSAQDTAIVITDPQNDFLSPDGVTWGLVGASVEENGTVGHIEQLF